MDTLAKKFLKKFTKIHGFMPNMVFGDSPYKGVVSVYSYSNSICIFAKICIFVNTLWITIVTSTL